VAVRELGQALGAERVRARLGAAVAQTQINAVNTVGMKPAIQVSLFDVMIISVAFLTDVILTPVVTHGGGGWQGNFSRHSRRQTGPT
jgi:hypothetical protein